MNQQASQTAPANDIQTGSQAEPRCILCGKCLEVCPLLAATGREELAPRAKGWLARHLKQSPGALAEADAAKLSGLCLSCGRCKEVCPQGVDVPGLVSGLRSGHPTFRHKIWKQWLAKADKVWPLAGKLAKALPEVLAPGRFGAALKGLRGLTNEPGVKPFVRLTAWPEQWRGQDVLLFPGCAGSLLATRWTDTSARILKGLGMRSVEAPFGCCGSPLGAAGFAPEQAAARARNLEIWRSAGRPMLAVYCASCLSGLRAYPAECFHSPDEMAAWAGAVTPLSTLLQDARFVVSENAPRAAGYHRPCHMEAKADPDRALLEAMLEKRLVPLADQCCGFGGVLRLTAPDLADAVGAKRAEGFGGDDGPDLVLTGCTACVSQLAALAPAGIATGHWLDMLDISG